MFCKQPNFKRPLLVKHKHFLSFVTKDRGVYDLCLSNMVRISQYVQYGND